MKQSEKEKENRIEDDLGFEINFGAFEPEPKVSVLQKYLFESRLFHVNSKFSRHKFKAGVTDRIEITIYGS